MSASPNLKLPYIDANQNQKSVTHNQALRMLDALVGLAVQTATLGAPPAAPADGQCWIAASGASGAWAGKDLNIAAWQDGAWAFYAPNAGFIAYAVDTRQTLQWNGSAWTPLLGGLTQLSLAALGLGTAADGGNPLSARLNNALFAALPTTASPAGSGDVRIKLSKQATANTASFLFQDNFAGRAEFGLCGDDDFHLKVSADGSAWTEAVRVTAASGALSLAAPARLAAYPVASLPTGSVGSMAFASNGRKPGEAAGAGTGVAVVFSNGAWRRLSDESAVAA